jgi:serine/threonine protein kinase
MAEDRIYCIEQARIQQEAIRKNFQSAGKGEPPFELVEMIGKGSFGRVYKAKYNEPPHNIHEFVAIKVINADAQDYRMIADERDNSFKDFNNELHILQVLSETGVKNINRVLDAFVLHAQLVWITEYCPGGSVRTIMTAQPGRRLAEKYVIPIAREIAIGLRGVHDAGIIHRDVKAANVLIHEDGRVQLCDFGTSSLLIGEKDKRSTIVGTPHWMPLEMHEASEKRQTLYRTEVSNTFPGSLWNSVTDFTRLTCGRTVAQSGRSSLGHPQTRRKGQTAS